MAKVLKVKFSHLGENNKHIYLKWNQKSGRYNDFRLQNENAGLLSGLIEDNSNWVCEQKTTQTELPMRYEVEQPNYYDLNEGINPDLIF